MPLDWKNESAKHFETHVNDSLQPLYQWFLKDLEDASDKSVRGLSVLDIGCGPGFMLKTLVEAGAAKVTGVDLSYSMLDCASKSGRSRRTMLMQADVTDLPICPECFDIVFSRGSIFFWPDLEKALRSISSVIKPGGVALLGGGYGLSTPQELVDTVRSRRSEEQGKKIPKIDLDLLLKVANRIGGNATIITAAKRGFWLVWRPKP